LSTFSLESLPIFPGRRFLPPALPNFKQYGLLDLTRNEPGRFFFLTADEPAGDQ
jgi:hypothetical protein